MLYGVSGTSCLYNQLMTDGSSLCRVRILARVIKCRYSNPYNGFKRSKFMELNDKKVKKIIVTAADGEVLAVITEDKIIEKNGVSVTVELN